MPIMPHSRLFENRAILYWLRLVMFFLLRVDVDSYDLKLIIRCISDVFLLSLPILQPTNVPKFEYNVRNQINLILLNKINVFVLQSK